MPRKLTPACIGLSSRRFAELTRVGSVVAILAWSVPAFPQSALGEGAGERARISAAKLQRVTDPSLVSPILSAAPTFTLESTADDTTANALLGIQSGDLTLSVKFSGPVRKGSATTFAGLDGLRNKAAVDAGIGYLYWDVADPAPVLKPACERLAKLKRVALAEVDCSLSGLREEERNTGEALVPYINPGNAYFFTARVKGAREDFEFLDSVTLTPTDPQTRTSSSFTVGVGWLSRANWVLGANYRHEKAYAAASAPTQVCRPASGEAMRCDEAIIGAPSEKVSEIYQVEVRRFLSSALALNPRFTRNATQKISAFEIPLYFLTGADGGLTGGVNIGWRSDQPGSAVTVFIGQALRLFTR